MRGQVGGRLSQGRVLPLMDDHVILQRVAAQSIAAGSEVPIQWDKVIFDRFNTFNPATPSLIRAPAGANWVRMTNLFVTWVTNNLTNIEIFYRFSASPNPLNYSFPIRENAQAFETARTYPYPWMQIYGGLTDISQAVYHAANANSVAFAQISLQFAR